MAMQRVSWTTSEKLLCEKGFSTPIILCLEPDLVAPKICTEQEAEQPYPYSTIVASMVCDCIPDTAGSYRYTFAYDDEQLVEGTLLKTSNIKGAFCKCCSADFAEDVIGDETYLKQTEQGQVLVTPHGCEYPIPAGGGSFDFVFPVTFVLGDGRDGDIIYPVGEHTLPTSGWADYRSYYFENCTVEVDSILRVLAPLSYGPGYDTDFTFVQLFVSDTLIINGEITANGLNGDPGVDQWGGGSTYDLRSFYLLPGPGGYLDFGTYGGNGASLGNPAQDGPSDWGSLSADGRMAGGHRGAGGKGGGPSGGTGGPSSLSSYFYAMPFVVRKYVPELLEIRAIGGIEGVIGGGAGGVGGGGGDATGTARGGGGGGGGEGGGSLYIAARHIVINSGGKISSNGGNGGNGANGTAGGGGDAAGGGGGGSGGGGGMIYLIYETLENNGTIEVLPGAPGLGGVGLGGYSNGEDGEVSQPGVIYRLNMQTGKFE